MMKLWMRMGVLFLIISCEKVDDIPPVITVTSPAVGITVSEIVSVHCDASDNVGIDHVELWIDGVSTGLTDDSKPYAIAWNTTQYIDGSVHVITVRAFDESDNTTDSEPVATTIDQTDAYPTPVNITSVVFDTETMTVSWQRSPDTDFQRYELYKAADTSSYSLLATIEHQDTLSYSMAEFDPQVDNYFRITTYDAVGLSKSGQSLSNELHTEPNPVDITEVSYTYTEMTIRWAEYEADLARMARLSKNLGKISGASQWTDFVSYELVHSTLADTVWTSLVTITEMNTISYTLSEFDPTHENLFGIIVTDFWGLTSMGMELSNNVEQAPQQSEIYPLDYSSGSITINWRANSEDDFVGYELYESMNSDMDNSSLVLSSANQGDTSYVMINPVVFQQYYYQVEVIEHWGLSTLSSVQTVIPGVFANTYGGALNDDGYSVGRTSDGGFIIVGSTQSFGSGSLDGWMIKTDGYGHEEWNTLFGGTDYDVIMSAESTTDGGFILVGSTRSSGNGYLDIWLIKTDGSGNEEWSRTFGGSSPDYGFSVQQTEDGGFILTGSNAADMWLIKTDAMGLEEWNNTVYMYGDDHGVSVLQTSDGGFVMAATESRLSDNIMLKKFDGMGNEVWYRIFGGSDPDGASSIAATSDGGFIVIGYTYTPLPGSFDMWLIKTDGDGAEEWNKTFGGDANEFGRSVRQTADGGYILSGRTESFGDGSSDAWLVRVDGLGNEVWNQTYGGSGFEDGFSVEQTSDGGFIMAGSTESLGHGGTDVWLLKTDPWGNTADLNP